MDIAAGDTDGADALRSFLRAGTAVPDEEMQDCWDAAVDATDGWIKPGFSEDAPAGVVQFVVNVAAHLWRVRDTGGDMQAIPDGTWSTQSSVTRNLVKRYAVLGGSKVRTPRTVA